MTRTRILKTRQFLLLIPLLISPSFASAETPSRITIKLLDPRGAIEGNHTVATQWRDGKADVVGMRVLNLSERKELSKLLRREMVDDSNVPFCGHSPAYAVELHRDGKQMQSVTLCGTCRTWARNGQLRVLHGVESLVFLDSLLPLPKVFGTVTGEPEKLLDPFSDDVKKPFTELESLP